MSFMTLLADAWRRHDSLVCVGLDPEPGRLPVSLGGGPAAIGAFCRAIVDATADRVCAYKPQIAHFAAQRAEDQLEALIAYIHERHPGIPVILDAKRGDIGSTAQHYAAEAFDRYGADAVTLNPYLGRDSAQPFLDRADKGVILLCRTSNPGARDFQDLLVDGRPLYQHVAETIATQWNGHGNCALVTGATWPEEIAAVRALVGDLPLLVPGVGAQGGDVEAVVRNGASANGTGLLISSSRAILYASNGEDFAEAARAATEALRTSINRYRPAA
ncbi:MAG TPA: orotidine-5'-phosphate decarboxylase [Dokdonella sp.]|uniref:orotidine-5'-phosphate decarboxylase n=1 Tax=Dokdonella sp. TaxID=2291710 RepID=UPI002C4CF3D3|nr:orotidine-5'-phosphate decarboxylase [Dokdonella sp.]HUD43781.1 orotidine-5'-phosphate decarboxylase [Dokdonella sp.]